MAGIDFVPDDYIQRRESNRANYLYLGLFVLMFFALLGTYSFLKLRQKVLDIEEKAVDTRMSVAQRAIAQLEELQRQRQDMMSTALLTAELIEPVPRSVLLALLTNTMPDGLSLSEIVLMQKKLTSAQAREYKSKYEAVKAANSANAKQDEFINTLDIEGYASNDIAVAVYIANLTESILLDDVRLVHSKEYDMPGGVYRQFKLSAIIKPGVHLTKKDVDEIINYEPDKNEAENKISILITHEQ